MNIAVVDDEKIIRQQIHNLIKKIRPDFCVNDFVSGEELLAAQMHFDIIFLDIQMNGIDGVETAEALRKRDMDTVLIFVTCFREYALAAFDVSAFHYLLKPIAEPKLTQVLECAAAEAKRRKSQKEQQIFVQTKNSGFTLNRNNILYIESKAKKVAIHMTDTKEAVTFYATMEELERQLGEGFYRCHRGYLVNMAHIAGYDNDNIYLSDGEKVYLTKKKHGEFVKTYMWYLQNGGVSCV